MPTILTIDKMDNVSVEPFGTVFGTVKFYRGTPETRWDTATGPEIADIRLSCDNGPIDDSEWTDELYDKLLDAVLSYMDAMYSSIEE